MNEQSPTINPAESERQPKTEAEVVEQIQRIGSKLIDRYAQLEEFTRDKQLDDIRPSETIDRRSFDYQESEMRGGGHMKLSEDGKRKISHSVSEFQGATNVQKGVSKKENWRDTADSIGVNALEDGTVEVYSSDSKNRRTTLPKSSAVQTSAKILSEIRSDTSKMKSQETKYNDILNAK